MPPYRGPVSPGLLPAAAQPLTVAIAHAKGGVGKTTTALILGRYLARKHRVALLDYDESQHLTDLVRDISPDGVVTNRLWLAQQPPRGDTAIVLIDSAPARGPETRRALIEADYVLIPAPPERMAVRAMVQMLDTVEDVRQLGAAGNPFLQVLGVVPTLYDQRWPMHAEFLRHIEDVCSARAVRVFPPSRAASRIRECLLPVRTTCP